MPIDISQFTSILQTKLNNADSLAEKDLLLLTKSLEAFTSVYDIKDMATAISSFQTVLEASTAANDAAFTQVETDLANTTTELTNLVNTTIANIDFMQPFVTSTSDPTFDDDSYDVGRMWINTTTGMIWYFVGLGYKNYANWKQLGTDEVLSYAEGWTYNQVADNGTQQYTFTVPANVTMASAVLVGAGGSGRYDWATSGGGGGALAWANFTVTPGEVLTVTIGGRPNQTAHGPDSILSSNSRGELFRAQGGQYSGTSRNTSYGNPVAGAVTPGNIDSGRGGLTSQNGYGGGGGAGGYTGSGGNGSYGSTQWNSNPYNGTHNGTGGAGGGGNGYGSSTYGFAGGGGVGIYGEGPSGTGSTGNNGNSFYGVSQNYQGKGGSGGFDGAPNNNSSITAIGGEGTGKAAYTQYHGEGGAYGGGGAGGGTSVSGNGNFCKGGQGAARILLGGSYPNNAAETSGEQFNV